MLTIAIIILVCHLLHRCGISNVLTRSVLRRATMLQTTITKKIILRGKPSRVIPGIAFLMLLVSSHAGAQGPWELKRSIEGIRIYTRSNEGTAIKALKANFDVKGQLDDVKSLLLEVSQQKDWVYATLESAVVKRISPGEIIYYSKKEMPWPVTDRDVVMHMKVTSNAEKGMLTLSAVAEDNAVPEKKGFVRIHHTEILWNVTALGNGMLRVEYQANADPGGSLPAWVTNMFLTKGPYETFLKFRKKIEGQQS